MNRVPSSIAFGLVAALALAACGAPRAVLMPAPPPEARKETAAPAPAVAERVEPPAPAGTTLPAENTPGAPDAAKTRAEGAALAADAAAARFELIARYAEACDRTEGAIARGAARDAVPAWRGLEDTKWGTDAVYNQGVLFQLAGDLDEAAAQYSRAADRSPAFEPPLANLLGISILRGDGPRMKSLLARVVPRGSPPPPQMLPELAVNAAAALMETGRREDAAVILLSLRDRGKATPALQWNLAVLSFRAEDRATARDIAASVPSGVANLFPVVASRFAWAKEGDRIPALGPVPPGMAGMAAISANLSAYAEYRSGNAAAAEKTLASTAAAASAPAEILTNIGILQAEQGRWKEARGNLERAVRENPQFAAGWLNLGIFREIYAGNLPGARECYDNYVKLGGWRKEEVRKWSDRLGQSASPRQ